VCVFIYIYIYIYSQNTTIYIVKIMVDQKQLKNVGSFKYLSSILTKDG